MKKIKISDIPWKELTTPYGRGTDIPRLIENRNYKELNNLLEHQETLWQVTPWGVYFLLIQLEEDFAEGKKNFSFDQMEIYDLVLTSFKNVIQNDYDKSEIFTDPLELISEGSLWSAPEDDDELYWEEEFPPGYDDISFLNTYYYSWKFINDKAGLLEKIKDSTDNKELKDFLTGILAELKEFSV